MTSLQAALIFIIYKKRNIFSCEKRFKLSKKYTFYYTLKSEKNVNKIAYFLWKESLVRECFENSLSF